MPRKRHTPEQIIRKLREAEVELAKGLTTGAGQTRSSSIFQKLGSPASRRSIATA